MRSACEGPGPSAAPAHNESLGIRFVRPAGLINEGRRRRPPNHERCRGPGTRWGAWWPTNLWDYDPVEHDGM